MVGLRASAPGWICAAALVAAGCGSEAPDKVELPAVPAVSADDFAGGAQAQMQQALRALEAAPDSAAANGDLAMLLDAYGRTDAAAALYERASLLDPGALRWRYYLGTALASQGESERAIEALRQTIAIDPEFVPGIRVLADALFEANRLDESREAYERSLARSPDDPGSLYGLGRIAAAQGDAVVAIEKLERATQIEPGFGAAHYELALAYRDAMRDADSRRAMERYEANPNGAPAADPLRAQVAALRIDATTRLARAAEMEKRGDLQGALAEHLAALEEQPDLAQTHINLISIYGRLGEKEKARDHAAKALELAPDRAELHYNLGVLDVSDRRIAEAEKGFRRAVELNSTYAPAMTNLGQMLEARQQYAEAAALYRKAVDAQPDYPLARHHFGRMLLAQGQAARAVEQFRAALQPETPLAAEAWMGLAAAYSSLGRREEAREAAERAKALAIRFGRQDMAKAVDRELERLRE